MSEYRYISVPIRIYSCQISTCTKDLLWILHLWCKSDDDDRDCGDDNKVVMYVHVMLYMFNDFDYLKSQISVEDALTKS